MPIFYPPPHPEDVDLWLSILRTIGIVVEKVIYETTQDGDTTALIYQSRTVQNYDWAKHKREQRFKYDYER